ncbi:MAG: T9SS type A sorting domain-containing protein, partial [Bacteroidales bacterium]
EAESIEICQVFIGLNEIIDNPISITLYPNPTSSSSRLEIDNVEGNIEITITDISGRKIQTMSTRANNKFETTIDLTTQSKGIYFISIVTEKTKRTEKLILK